MLWGAIYSVCQEVAAARTSVRCVGTRHRALKGGRLCGWRLHVLLLRPQPRIPLLRLLGNSNLESVVNWLLEHESDPDIDRLPLEIMKGVNQGTPSGPYDIALIQAQIRNLAQEVRDLTLSRPITILNGKSDSGGGLSSYILPAAAIGAMGYCYMWWKGLSLSDVMFVTKRNMANAVQSMSKQLEQVSSALAATKRHLTQRLENLDGKMDEQVEVSKAIRNEVNDVKDDLSQIGFDIETIQQMVAGLEGKIDLLENKQDVANTGIWYLCQVAGGLKDGINTKFFQEASEKLKLSHSAQPENKPVKGLEFFSESTKEQKVADSKPIKVAMDAEKSEKTTAVKGTAVHRSIRFSYRKEGLAL